MIVPAPISRRGTKPCRAVLMLHGILSAPQFFRFLMPALPPETAIEAPLLRGHGTVPHALALADMDTWKTQVHSAFLALKREYGSVHIIAHSMGTLFAMQLACAYPESIPEMLLLNVPLYPRLTPDCALYSLVTALGLPHQSRYGSAMAEAYSLSPEPHLSVYAGWIPRYRELFREMEITRSALDGMHVPCTAFSARHDELCSPRSRILLRAHPEIRLIHLHRSTHFYYAPPDARRIRRQTAAMLRRTDST